MFKHRCIKIYTYLTSRNNHFQCLIYFNFSISAPCDLSDDDMSIVDTTDGDSIVSNGVVMVKDKRSKSGYKKASDRKVRLVNVFEN